jgi:hypothetical protein
LLSLVRKCDFLEDGVNLGEVFDLLVDVIVCSGIEVIVDLVH